MEEHQQIADSSQVGEGLGHFDIIQSRVDELVNSIQQEFTKPDTHVRLTINSDGLEGSIHVPYFKVSKLDSEKIFNTVKTILQSSKSLPLKKWYITVNSVDPSSTNENDTDKLYSGNAKRRWLTEPIYDWLIATQSNGKRNQNVVEVGGDNDNLCLIKVIFCQSTLVLNYNFNVDRPTLFLEHLHLKKRHILTCSKEIPSAT